MAPKKKWSEPEKSRTMQSECPEELIQAAVEKYIKIKRIDFFRIPDGFFSWVIINAPKNVGKWFCRMFGGKPDITLFEPIVPGVALSLLLELKTQDKKGRAVGKLHGRQNHHKNDWIICRSVDQAKNVIDRFQKRANEIREFVRLKYKVD